MSYDGTKLTSSFNKEVIKLCQTLNIRFLHVCTVNEVKQSHLFLKKKNRITHLRHVVKAGQITPEVSWNYQLE